MLRLSNTWDEFKSFFARSLGQTHIDFKEPAMVVPKNKLLEKAKHYSIQTDLFGNLIGFDEKGKIVEIPKEEPLSDFNNKLKTALNFNPKDKE